MAANLASDDCKECDGTGWTEVGWETYRQQEDNTTSATSANDFKGDCTACHGTGKRP